MSVRNCDVTTAWRRGKWAVSNSMHTDGRKLWSYGLIIGTTNCYDKKVAVNYTAPEHFVSMTTSQHVGLAKRVADLVTEPSPYWHRSG